jgi:hypothetical protein
LWAPQNPIEPYFSDEDSHNRDSTLMIDTCGLYEINPFFYWYYPEGADTSESYYLGIPSIIYFKEYLALNRFYSKSIWGLNISWSVFDTTGKDLNTLHYFTVDDIDSNNHEIFDAFQQVISNFGNIKFRFATDRNLSVQDGWDSGIFVNAGYFKGSYAFIETDNLINSGEFVEFINGLIPNIECKYLTEFSLPLSVVIDPADNNSIKLSGDYNLLTVTSKLTIKNIGLYSLTGIQLLDLKEVDSINEYILDISYLQNGIYFIKVNNSIHKFMVVR